MTDLTWNGVESDCGSYRIGSRKARSSIELFALTKMYKEVPRREGEPEAEPVESWVPIDALQLAGTPPAGSSAKAKAQAQWFANYLERER